MIIKFSFKKILRNSNICTKDKGKVYLNLVILFLSVALGSVTFVYYLNTSEVVNTQNLYNELLEIYKKIDLVCHEIENCKEIINPRFGSSKECIFNKPMQHLSSLEKSGFLIKGNSFMYITMQNNQVYIPSNFKGLHNPILDKYIVEGFFNRLSQSLLELTIKVRLKNNPNYQKEIKRLVYLKNL